MGKIIINDYRSYLSLEEKNELIKIFSDNFHKIVKTLGLNYKFQPMTFYLYPDEKTKIQETGEDGYAETNRETFSVYMVYNDDIQPIGPHEQVHLLTNHIGTPNFVLSEGLAEYFEHSWRSDINGKPVRLNNDKWVKRFIKEKSYISINDLFDDLKFWELNENGTISYPESGSFVTFLINKYGVENFIEAYKKCTRRPADPEYNYKIFRQFFGVSVAEAETEWIDKING